MSGYTQTTYFGPKDSLLAGDPDKVIQGTQVDAEFLAIATAIDTKVDTGGTAIAVSSTTANLDMTKPSIVTPASADYILLSDTSNSNTCIRAALTDVETVMSTIRLAGTNVWTGTNNFQAAVDCDTTLNVDGNTTLGGTLTVASTLGVTGTSTLAALSATNVTASGTLGVTGATTLSSATLSSTLGVTGTSTLAAVNATNGTFSGTLGVTGASTLSSATLSSTLGVTGNTTLTNATCSGTLGVTGTSTLGATNTSTLTSSGAATLNSLAVTNAATVGSTLGVTGNTTLSGQLSVDGADTALHKARVAAYGKITYSGGTPSLSDSYGAGTLTDVATGQVRVAITTHTAASLDQWQVLVNAYDVLNPSISVGVGYNPTTVEIYTYDDAGTAVDSTIFFLVYHTE